MPQWLGRSVALPRSVVAPSARLVHQRRLQVRPLHSPGLPQVPPSVDLQRRQPGLPREQLPLQPLPGSQLLALARSQGLRAHQPLEWPPLDHQGRRVHRPLPGFARPSGVHPPSKPHQQRHQGVSDLRLPPQAVGESVWERWLLTPRQPLRPGSSSKQPPLQRAFQAAPVLEAPGSRAGPALHQPGNPRASDQPDLHHQPAGALKVPAGVNSPGLAQRDSPARQPSAQVPQQDQAGQYSRHQARLRPVQQADSIPGEHRALVQLPPDHPPAAH